MKRVVILVLSLVGIACAQEPKIQPNNSEKKRLDSVTWDLKSQKLIWVVARGTVANGNFTPTATDRYEISPDDATMTYGTEIRGFTEEEAASLHKLLNTLSLYCAESVVWWDKGEGEKIDKHSQGSADRQKVEQRNKKKNESKKDEMIAALTYQIARTLQ